jgi:uncharacterized protein (TIGR03382 family)
MGQTGWVTIRVANPGGSPLTLGTPALVAGDTGDFALHTGAPFTYGSNVPAGGFVEFGVAFNPATVGTKVAIVAFTHSGANTVTPFEFELMGRGIVTAAEIEVRESNDSGPVITYNQPALGTGRDFGNVSVAAGPTAPLVIRVENTGNVDMQLGTPEFASASQTPGAFALDSSGMLTLLRPGMATSFTVRFTPNSYGMKSAIIGLPHDAPNESSPFLIPIRGFADAPLLQVREGSELGPTLTHDAPAAGPRDFGTLEIAQMPSSALQIAVANSGSSTMNLNMPTLTGPHFNQFTLHANSMALTLIPGQVTTFTVRFDATQVGVKEAQINIGHNDPAGPSPFIVRVKGVATDPAGVRITSPTNFAEARVDRNFGPVQLEADGGTPSYFWSLRPGEALPQGLHMNIFGVIMGRPEGPPGTHEFEVRVTDSMGGTNDKMLRMTIYPRPGESVDSSGGNCAAANTRGVPPAALLALLLAAFLFARRRMFQVK